VGLFLRTVRLNKWHPYPPEECNWLPKGELHADPLADLATTRGALSIWRIEDGETDERRVIAALASRRDSLQSIDYIVFGSDILKRLNIQVERSEGQSADNEINKSWHCDMIQLSAWKLVEFAETVVIHENVIPKRITKGRLKEFIQDAVSAKQVDPGEMKTGIRDKLDI